MTCSWRTPGPATVTTTLGNGLPFASTTAPSIDPVVWAAARAAGNESSRPATASGTAMGVCRFMATLIRLASPSPLTVTERRSEILHLLRVDCCAVTSCPKIQTNSRPARRDVSE